MVVTTTSTSGQRLEDDGEETDPIRLYFQSSISQQCAYVCSRSTSSLSPPMTCRHPCYRLLRCRAVITKNMSRKKHSSFLTGTTEWYYWSFLPSHSSRCSSFCSVIARPVLRKHLRLFPWNTKSNPARFSYHKSSPFPFFPRSDTQLWSFLHSVTAQPFHILPPHCAKAAWLA